MSSTRACVAMLVDRTLRFRGALVEQDGEPTAMGRVLRGMGRAAGAGFSSWLGDLASGHPEGWESVRYGVCLCGTGRPVVEVTEANARSLGIAFVYAFEETSHALLVLAPKSPASGGEWWIVLEMPLDGAEPDWTAVERAARLGGKA